MLPGEPGATPVWKCDAGSLLETERLPLHAIDDSCWEPCEEHEKKAILERDQVAGLGVTSSDRSFHHLSHALWVNSRAFQAPQEALTDLQALGIGGICCDIPGEGHRVALPETRPGEAWFDDDHLDAKRCQFATERVREALHTVFGRGIGSRVGQ